MKKFIFSTISLILILSINISFAVSAFAADEFTCDKIDDPEVKSGFFVIIEEPLITKDDEGPNKKNILCFRVCSTKVDGGKLYAKLRRHVIKKRILIGLASLVNVYR